MDRIVHSLARFARVTLASVAMLAALVASTLAIVVSIFRALAEACAKLADDSATVRPVTRAVSASEETRVVNVNAIRTVHVPALPAPKADPIVHVVQAPLPIGHILTIRSALRHGAKAADRRAALEALDSLAN